MLFTPDLVTLDDHGVTSNLHKPKLWGPKVCVIPRSECSFRRFVLKGKNRHAVTAAQLQVKQEAATPDSQVFIVRDKIGEGASAFLFSPPLGFDGVYIPESLILSPMETGARVVAGLKGYEGQVWVNKVLISSRWWAQQPSQREWDLFIRASKIGIEPGLAAVPEARAIPINAKGVFWQVSGDYVLHTLSPKRLLWLSGFSGVVIGLFLGTQYLRAAYTLQQINKEIASVSDGAQFVLSQRRRALMNVKSIENIRSLGDEAQILSALYGVTAVLKQHGLIVVSLRVSDNSLEISLEGDTDLPIPDIVNRLESVPSLKEASAALDVRGRLTIKALLVPFKEEETLRLTQEKL